MSRPTIVLLIMVLAGIAGWLWLSDPDDANDGTAPELRGTSIANDLATAEGPDAQPGAVDTSRFLTTPDAFALQVVDDVTGNPIPDADVFAAPDATAEVRRSAKLASRSPSPSMAGAGPVRRRTAT